MRPVRVRNDPVPSSLPTRKVRGRLLTHYPNIEVLGTGWMFDGDAFRARDVSEIGSSHACNGAPCG